MDHNQSAANKTCQYCHKALHGRSDMRFCNDSCRNTFNREKKAAQKVTLHENAPQIIRIIKTNYEILKSGNRNPMADNESVFAQTKDLIQRGFNPRFFTSRTTDESGEEWCCIFEMCFSMGEKYTFIKDFPGQAEL